MSTITKNIQSNVFCHPEHAEKKRLEEQYTLKQVTDAVTELFENIKDQGADTEKQFEQAHALRSLKTCIQARKAQKGAYVKLVRLIKKIFGIQDSLSLAQDKYKAHKATFRGLKNNFIQPYTAKERSVFEYKNERIAKHAPKEQKLQEEERKRQQELQEEERKRQQEKDRPTNFARSFKTAYANRKNPDQDLTIFQNRHLEALKALKKAIKVKDTNSFLIPIRQNIFRGFTTPKGCVIKFKKEQPIAEGANRKAKLGFDENGLTKIILIAKKSETTNPKIKRQLQIQGHIQKSKDDRLHESTLLPDAVVEYTGSHERQKQDKIAFIQDYCPNGDMSSVITSNGRKKFAPEQRWDMILQVINLVIAFHENGIYLRDMKPENFLIFMDTNGAITVKCNDFDTSYHAAFYNAAYDSRVRGTLSYFSPSYYDDLKNLQKTKGDPHLKQNIEDVIKRQEFWSLAVVLYNLCCQKDVNWSEEMRKNADYFLLANKSGIDQKKLEAALDELFTKEQRDSNPLCKLIYEMLSNPAFSLDQLKEGVKELKTDETRQQFLADFSI